MQFQVLALRLFDPAPTVGYCADVTLGYADITIVGCRLGHDDLGRPFVAFPKLAGDRARLHCKDSGTRRKMVDDAVALFRAMQAAAVTPLATAPLTAEFQHDPT